MYEDAGHVEDDFFNPRQQISRSWGQILPSRHGHFLFDPTVLVQVTDELVRGGPFERACTYIVTLPKGSFPVVWFPLVKAVRISYSDK